VKTPGRDVSAIMRKVRSRDTTPEVVFRKALWARGLRYRTCRSPLAGKPDVVLSRVRLVVFIDGDFWHGGQWRKRRLTALEDQFRNTPTRDYWLAKIRRNMQRDCAATAALMAADWKVLRFWETQVFTQLDRCVDLTVRAARGEIAPDPRSTLPAKTFVQITASDARAGRLRADLEEEGWTPAGLETAQPLALAAGAFDSPTPDGFWLALRGLPQRPPLVLLQSSDIDQASAGLARLGYSTSALGPAGLVVGHALHDCAGIEPPRPPEDANPVQWIARYYLNPLVSDSIRGRLMGRTPTDD
jgi:DNA mismatch endonuclease (patch repair protein)